MEVVRVNVVIGGRALVCPRDCANYGVHPPCWTDGVCWNENEDGERSDHPQWWALMPQG